MIPIDGQVVLTAKAMRAAEQVLFDGGMRETALMQRAGEAVAQSVARLAAGREVLVLCGPGNNGGDGYVAAASLRRQGLPVRVTAVSDDKMTLDANHPLAGQDLVFDIELVSIG